MINRLLKAMGLTTGASLLGVAAFYLWATSGAYPRQKYAEIVAYGEATSTTSGAPDELMVVSYNLGYLSGLANPSYIPDADQTRPVSGQELFEKNMAGAIATLRTLNPDVIALQEIDLDAHRSGHQNQVEALAKGIGMVVGVIAVNWDKNYVPFPYWPPSDHFGKVVSGQAVLSRYPIQRNHRIVLEKVASQPFYYQALVLDRLAQVTELTVNGRPLILINLHLEAFDAPTRINQSQVVKDLAESYAKNYPVLLVGDFNSAVNRREEGSVKSIDTFAKSALFTSAVPPEQWTLSNQTTYPSNAPRYKFDYIFYTPATIELIETQVITEAGQVSDHLPVMMRLRLK